MILSPVQSGFRTLNAQPSRIQHLSHAQGRMRMVPEVIERWGFEAAVSDADEVFLVLEEHRRASRWTPMTHSLRTGRWSVELSLKPGRRKVSLYAQRGSSLRQCDSGSLTLKRPTNAGGGVRFELPALKWQA